MRLGSVKEVVTDERERLYGACPGGEMMESRHHPVKKIASGPLLTPTPFDFSITINGLDCAGLGRLSWSNNTRIERQTRERVALD